MYVLGGSAENGHTLLLLIKNIVWPLDYYHIIMKQYTVKLFFIVYYKKE